MSSPSFICQRPGCGKAAPLKCGSCKCVEYCSRDCQKATWKQHKQLCTAVSGASTTTCLILDGMGALGRDDINTKPIYNELTSRYNMHVSVVHLDDGFITPEQIAVALDNKDTNIKTLIVLGWGSGDDDLGLDFANSDAFRVALVSWVEAGGRLLVQGERISHSAGDWPQWFDLAWTSSDYCRTTHTLNATHWFKKQAKCPSMNVKACLVTNVEPEDNLYGTGEGAVTHSLVPGFGGNAVPAGQSAFTLAKFGEGTVSFFGDVNIEDETVKTVGIVANH
jgi:hypothetical protein